MLVAIAEGRTLFESETLLKTLNDDKVAVLLTIVFRRSQRRWAAFW